MPSPLLALILSLGLQSWHAVAFCCGVEDSDFTPRSARVLWILWCHVWIPPPWNP